MIIRKETDQMKTSVSRWSISIDRLFAQVNRCLRVRALSILTVTSLPSDSRSYHFSPACFSPTASHDVRDLCPNSLFSFSATKVSLESPYRFHFPASSSHTFRFPSFFLFQVERDSLLEITQYSITGPVFLRFLTITVNQVHAIAFNFYDISISQRDFSFRTISFKEETIDLEHGRSLTFSTRV